MSLNKEYYSFGLTMIPRRNAKKILIRIITESTEGHEKLLDLMASVLYTKIYLSDKRISLSYLKILHTHPVTMDYDLSNMLMKNKYEHLHEFIVTSTSVPQNYPHTVLMYAIKINYFPLYSVMLYQTTLNHSDVLNICMDLCPSDTIRFINAAYKHHNISIHLKSAISEMILMYERYDIIDTIKKTNIRDNIIQELLIKYSRKSDS